MLDHSALNPQEMKTTAPLLAVLCGFLVTDFYHQVHLFAYSKLNLPLDTCIFVCFSVSEFMTKYLRSAAFFHR